MGETTKGSLREQGQGIEQPELDQTAFTGVEPLFFHEHNERIRAARSRIQPEALPIQNRPGEPLRKKRARHSFIAGLDGPRSRQGHPDAYIHQRYLVEIDADPLPRHGLIDPLMVDFKEACLGFLSRLQKLNGITPGKCSSRNGSVRYGSESWKAPHLVDPQPKRCTYSFTARLAGRSLDSRKDLDRPSPVHCREWTLPPTHAEPGFPVPPRPTVEFQNTGAGGIIYF